MSSINNAMVTAKGDNNEQGGGEQRKYKPSVTPCKSCDMDCCPADSRCGVCVMTDDEVRNMKIRKGAKFVIFVMRGWKKDRKLNSMKGVVPDQEYFKKKMSEAKTYRESQGANEVCNLRNARLEEGQQAELDEGCGARSGVLQEKDV